MYPLVTTPVSTKTNALQQKLLEDSTRWIVATFSSETELLHYTKKQ